MKTKAICSFFVLFAIVSGIGATTPAAFADPHGIDTADNDLVQPGCVDTEVGCYTPNTLTVDVGHIVTMTNVDSGIHTFTSGTVDGFVPSPSDVFDSGILNPNDSFELDTTDMEAGDYPYYCTLHVWMQGVLIVQEATAEEAVTEETTAEEAVTEETTAEEAVTEETTAEEAVTEETTEEAVTEEAVTEETTEEAVTEETTEEAVTEETTEEAVTEETTEEAVTEEMQMEETMMEEVELMVIITESAMGDGTHVYLEFSEIHVNYEMIGIQNDEEIFTIPGHAMEMTSDHHIDAVGTPESPLDIKIVSLGIGPPDAEDDWTGPIGTIDTIQIVPEFGTITMMVLAIAIISIVAVTAKSRVIPRF